jgi:hypothetical protein
MVAAGEESRGDDGGGFEQCSIGIHTLRRQQGGAVGVPLGTVDEFEAHGRNPGSIPGLIRGGGEAWRGPVRWAV